MSNLESLAYFKTEITLLIGALVVLFADFFVKNKKNIGVLALVFIGASCLFLRVPAQPYPLFHGFFILDGMTHFFRLTVLGVIALTLLFSLAYSRIPAPYAGEYYSLILFIAVGLILMAAASHLLMIFLAVEFVSLVSYLLVGFLKKDPRSKEASLKYLLFGSMASGLMLYGMSLLFGISGALDLDIISGKIAQQNSPLLLAALFMIFAGIGFKISMAPFHLWAPDVYEGAPTPITAFLTVAPKALGFAVLIRLLSTAFMPIFQSWAPVIFILSILTMTLGNVTAVAQTNVKRLLAYSSIAQAGYILMGIAVFSESSIHAVLYYLVAYAFTNLGAFAVVIAISESAQSDSIDSYAGLAGKSPVLAASLTVFLLSLAGIPPFAGFVGKFLVFASAVEAGYIALVIAAVINSVVAGFYYFKLVRLMYLVPAAETSPVPQPWSIRLSLGLTAAGTVVFGVLPMPILAFLEKHIF